MPRALRIEYPVAIYHVMNRGDHCKPMFGDGVEHRVLLAIAGHARTTTAESRTTNVNLQPEMQHEFNLA